jgi:flagellar biogenesis protein FliO
MHMEGDMSGLIWSQGRPERGDTVSSRRRRAGVLIGLLTFFAVLAAGDLLADTTSDQNPSAAPDPATSLPASTGMAVAGTESAGESAAESASDQWPLWNQQPAEASWSPDGSSPVWMAGRVLFAVLLVIGLVVLLLLFLRRYGIMNGASGIGAGRLQLLANLPLGPRRTVYLVRVDGIELLVASAGDGLRLLTELPSPRDTALAVAGSPLPAASGVASAGTMPAGAAPSLRAAIDRPPSVDTASGGVPTPPARTDADSQHSPFFAAFNSFLNMDASTPGCEQRS